MSGESLEELRERLLRDEHTQELIRMRAFEIYKLRGGKPGGEAHDWFQAQSEVLTFLIEEESRSASESQSSAAGAKAAAAPPTLEPDKPSKAASKPRAARKTKEASAEKKPAKRAAKKPAESSEKARPKAKKEQ
ncbi:MAG TPA: DUF2934 domain-containing protein [Blastocatellia bacterium]|nr:DUF2934 domain-containing protein [Blastocatellia bacterium]